MNFYPDSSSAFFAEVAGEDLSSLRERHLFGMRTSTKSWPFLWAGLLLIVLLTSLYAIARSIFVGDFRWDVLIVPVVAASALFQLVMNTVVDTELEFFKTGIAYNKRLIPDYFMPRRGDLWDGMRFADMLYLDLRGKSIAFMRAGYQDERSLAAGLSKTELRKIADMLVSYQKRGDITTSLDIKTR